MDIASTFEEESCFCDEVFMTSTANLSTYAAGRRSVLLKITSKNLESITTSVPFIFRKIPIFTMIPDPDKLFEYCSSKKFKAGCEISQLGDSLYYIVTGSVNGTHGILNTGSFFGHNELMDGTGIVHANITLTSPSLLFIVSSEGFNDPLFAEVREVLQATSMTADEEPPPEEAAEFAQPLSPSMQATQFPSLKRIKSLKRSKSKLVSLSISTAESDVNFADRPWMDLGGALGGPYSPWSDVATWHSETPPSSPKSVDGGGSADAFWWGQIQTGPIGQLFGSVSSMTSSMLAVTTEVTTEGTIMPPGRTSKVSSPTAGSRKKKPAKP